MDTSSILCLCLVNAPAQPSNSQTTAAGETSSLAVRQTQLSNAQDTPTAHRPGLQYMPHLLDARAVAGDTAHEDAQFPYHLASRGGRGSENSRKRPHVCGGHAMNLSSRQQHLVPLQQALIQEILRTSRNDPQGANFTIMSTG
ncbi:hypothetical protein GX50_00413 [[Emmonsia] crescens]|uniref:Uncharacterized protein n=1 Tax=[Emmonsia] crescens TaxID=73230 RepID=A0A2B7ZU87_9EURO|nr:hypothetical protein GX50_00413 [Emmonsia crescens]